jgi:hypothetical protein
MAMLPFLLVSWSLALRPVNEWYCVYFFIYSIYHYIDLVY